MGSKPRDSDEELVPKTSGSGRRLNEALLGQTSTTVGRDTVIGGRVNRGIVEKMMEEDSVQVDRSEGQPLENTFTEWADEIFSSFYPSVGVLALVSADGDDPIVTSMALKRLERERPLGSSYVVEEDGDAQRLEVRPQSTGCWLVRDQSTGRATYRGEET
jgi:hypothetical protein